jgi:alpha-ketoglutarate-dependent taurine dioxygenase
MKIIPLNNCGVEIADIDISTLTDDQYQQIKEVYQEHLIIVFRNQPVQVLPFAKLCQKLGIGIANWSGCIWDFYGNLQEGATLEEGLWHDILPDPFTYKEADDKFYVQRVTGEQINNQDSGWFANPELDWHNNINNPNKARGVGLQAVRGVENTGTAFLDTTKAYEALSDELKKRCQGVIGKYKFTPDTIGYKISDWHIKFIKARSSEPYEMPLVNHTECSRPGLYFPYLNNCEFPSDPELVNLLKDHCLQDKFMYNHWWKPGDIVISEQLLTLHKRLLKDQSLNATRVLHRYTFNM